MPWLHCSGAHLSSSDIYRVFCGQLVARRGRFRTAYLGDSSHAVTTRMRSARAGIAGAARMSEYARCLWPAICVRVKRLGSPSMDWKPRLKAKPAMIPCLDVSSAAEQDGIEDSSTERNPITHACQQVKSAKAEKSGHSPKLPEEERASAPRSLHDGMIISS